MPDTYTVNVSSINDFMSCRWRWVAKWCANRVPKEESLPLTFGKMLHTVFELHFDSGCSMDQSVAQVLSQWKLEAASTLDIVNREVALKAVEQLENLREPLAEWEDQYPIEMTLAVEDPFVIESPFDKSILLQGRPDRESVCFGKLFHVQTKSIGPGKNLALFTELAGRSLHEAVYGEALVRKYPDIEYGGTLFNLVRKLKYRGVPTKAFPDGKILHTPQEMMWQTPISYPESRRRALVANATRWAVEMRETYKKWLHGGIWPLPNEHMNGGFFGNKIDPYFRVLQGEWSLEDDRYFKSREETYAIVEEE